MSTQPEALRLAAELTRYLGCGGTASQAAAELRRLSAENETLQAENAKLHGWFEAEAQAGGGLQRRLNRAEAQRDALLGLLKEARKIIRASSSRNLVKDWDQRTTAAIKAVEENK